MDEKQKNLGKRLEDGMEKMVDSDRPGNVTIGALQMIGNLKERGDNSLGLKAMEFATVLVAKLQLWSKEDINKTIEEGRKIARMAGDTENKS
jgi:hypothetical protein